MSEDQTPKESPLAAPTGSVVRALVRLVSAIDQRDHWKDTMTDTEVHAQEEYEAAMSDARAVLNLKKWPNHSRGRPQCPCGFIGHTTNIRAHRAQCPAWRGKNPLNAELCHRDEPVDALKTQQR